MRPKCEKRFLLRNLPRADLLQRLARFCPSGANDATVSAVSAYNALLETSGALLNHLNCLMSREGLTQARFRVLFLIRHSHGGEEGAHPFELAKLLKVERATITSLIDGLERDGFVRREPSARDRRSIRVVLTAKGRRIIAEVAPKRMRDMMGIMGVLSTAECKTLSRLLDKLERRLAQAKD